jgi:hypothetical protein
MSLPQTVAEVLREHVTLEVEGIDRMYLNVYVPHGASPVFSSVALILDKSPLIC